GTTPEHIRALAETLRGVAPRKQLERSRALRLAGLESFNVDERSLFVNVGERTNVTGSKAFARLVLADDYPGALAVARQQVENGAQVIDVNMDEAMLDSEKAMTTFLSLVASEPDIARVPQVRRRSRGHGLRREGPGRLARPAHRGLPARLRPADAEGGVPSRGHRL